MGLFALIKGVRDNIFGVGGQKGVRVKSDAVNGGGLQVARWLQNDEDTHLNVMHADAPSSDNGSTSLHSATIGDVMDKHALVMQGFDGDAAPTASSYTGQYWFCHTTGTTSGTNYTAGQLYKAEKLDKSLDGASTIGWVQIDLEENGQHIVTSATYTPAGTPELQENSIYAYEGGNWVYKGGSSTTAADGWKTIKINFNTSSLSSTTSIPTNAIIKRTLWNIKTEYSTISASLAINGQEIGSLLSGERYVNQYIDDSVHTVIAGNVVDVTLTGAAGGTGEVYISYVVPQT